MKSHVWRPHFAVIALVIIILIARIFLVPKDFGIHERGYMYGLYRKSSEEDWKKITVKYKSREYCKDCHSENYSMIMQTPHAVIQCENCHGPAREHPDDPPKLDVDKSRQQCLRCHYPLPYPTSGRAKIRGIDPDKHNPGMECSVCHNPHKPDLEGMK
ncbi:MAG: cytochrome c3 family protein [Syntrophales bacterium]|nr:cytochrome c3 family protein [Syntrophales bacterium]